MTAKYKLIASTLLLGAAIISPLGATAPASSAQQTEQQEKPYADTLNQMASAIAERYPIEATADKIASALRSGVKSGSIKTDDSDAFLKTANALMWGAAQDLHLKLTTEKALQERMSRIGGGRTPTMRRVRVPQNGGPLGTTQIASEMLSDATGLVTISSAIYRNPDLFVPALKAISTAENVIIDLRTVPGGSVPGVLNFISHFYDRPTHVYSNITRQAEAPQEAWTEETALGDSFADKDVYVLISGRTASGAEAISFGLKNTDRAILVGEKTAGAGNAGAFMPVGQGLMLFLPFAQTINAQTGEPWEGTGVEPHHEAAADDALNAALALIAKAA